MDGPKRKVKKVGKEVWRLAACIAWDYVVIGDGVANGDGVGVLGCWGYF